MFTLTNHQGNANQNHNDISFHTCQVAIIKKRKMTKEVEKLEPLPTLGGNVQWCNHYGKQNYGYDSSNPISEYLSKGTEIRILEEILALPCSLQHYSQVSGTLIYPTDKWIHTHTHTHTRAYTLEYSPALKKEGNPATWMNLQDIMLNEVCKSQKDKYCMNLLVT